MVSRIPPVGIAPLQAHSDRTPGTGRRERNRAPALGGDWGMECVPESAGAQPAVDAWHPRSLDTR